MQRRKEVSFITANGLVFRVKKEQEEEMLQGMTEVERMQYSQKKLLVRMEIEEEKMEKKRLKHNQ